MCIARLDPNTKLHAQQLYGQGLYEQGEGGNVDNKV